MLDPSQAVARLVRVQPKSGHAPVGNVNYVLGQFYRFVPNAPPSTKSMKVGALVFRGDNVAVGKEGMLLALHDRVCTGPDTLGLIEFLIGGRTSLSESTEVVIDSERSVFNVNAPTGLAAFMSLFKNNQLRRPIEIQTNGGTMGIKG